MARQGSSSPVTSERLLDQDDLAPVSQVASPSSPKGRAEASSLKRGRAESVEPSQPNERVPTAALAKKNRLAPTTSQTPSKPLDPDSSPNLDNLAVTNATTQPDESEEKDETKTVGEVRRKVEKMTYDEELEVDQREETGDGGVVELGLPEKGEGDGPSSAMSISTRPESEVGDKVVEEKEDGWEKIDKDEAGESKEDSKNGSVQEGLKRKALDRSDNSYAKENEETQVKRQKDKDTPPPTDENTTPAAASVVVEDGTALEAEPVKPAESITKPTSFASFSSTPSPFASKSTAAASPFAAPKSGPSVFGSASTSTPAGKSVFSGSGFGNYSSSFSPFAAKKSKPATETKEEGGEEESSAAGPSTFGDILKAGGDAKATDEDEDKAKVQMTEQDVHTGEEEEETLFQTRTKLYVMQADGGWKERGLGVLKLNTRRQDGKSARLVMRADGVLRVILNVSLYVGMSCLEDGKHVRMTVFENGERRLITFRTGSNKAASELSGAIHDHIPLEPSGSLSPDPTAVAVAQEV